MTDVTSNLGVVVKTGDAAAQLLALSAALHGTATGMAQLGAAVTAHAGNIQSALASLAKTGFTGLSTALSAETGRVTTQMDRLEHEVTAAAERSGKKAGKKLAGGVAAGLSEGSAEMLSTADRQAQELGERYIGRSNAIHKIMLATAVTQGKENLAQVASDESKIKAFREGIGAQHLAQIASDEAKIKAFREGIGAQHLAQIASDEAKIKAFREGIGAQHLAQVASDESKIKAFREGIGAQHLAQIASDEAKIKAFREGIGAQHLAQIASDEAKIKAFREGIGAQRLVEIDREEQALDARRSKYVGRTSTLGGFATATNSQPIQSAIASNEAAAALGRQEAATHKSASATKAWSAASRDAHDVARGLSGALGGLWLTYGQLIPIMAGFAIAASLKGAFSASKDFAYQMEFVGAVSGDSAKQIDAVSSSLITMAKASMFKPLELAQGMRVLAQAGMTTAAALATLPTVMALATVGETDLATAAETATGIMHAFGLQTSDIGHIGDVIAKAAAISVTSVASMSESMKQASTIAQQYDLSLTDVSAALVALAERNITGQAAGTAFRNMMNELSNPTEKAQRALNKLGVTLYDSHGNTKRLTTVMDELRKAMGMYDQQSQNLLSSSIFGERGSKPAQAILHQRAQDWADMVKKLDESNGFLDQSMARLENTVEGRFKNMAANAQAAMLSIGEGSKQPLMDLANTLSELFNNKNLIGGIQSLANGIIGLTNFIAEHIKGLGMIAGGYLAFKAAGFAVTTLATVYMKLRDAQVIVATATGVLMGAQTAQAAMMGTTLPSAAMAATGALRILSAAMLANPVTAVLLGVGLLAAAYLTLRDNTTKASKAAEAAHQESLTTIGLLDRKTKATWDLIKAKRIEMGLDKAPAEVARGSIIGQRDGLQSEVDGLSAEVSAQSTSKTRRVKVMTRAGTTYQDEAKTYNPRTGYDVTDSERAKINRLAAAKQELAQVNDRLYKSGVADYALAQLNNQAEAQKAADDKASNNVGTGHLTPEQLGIGKHTRSPRKPKTDPIPVQDYSEKIKAYSTHLSEIDSVEQSALTRSKAIQDAGLSSEKAYLAERNSIRAKADADAKTQLDEYLQAQAQVADTALSAQAKQATEAKAKGLTNDAATINKMTALGNQAKEAWDKADRARTEYDLHSKQRTDAAELDTLAQMKAKYGNPDDAIKAAKEANAAITAEIAATKGLKDITRDKNTVAMEGALRHIDAEILELEATKNMTAAIRAQIAVLKEKQGTLQGEATKYGGNEVEKFVSGKETENAGGTDKFSVEITKVNQQYAQMYQKAMDATYTLETDKTAMIARITEQRRIAIGALENKRNVSQLKDGEALFTGLAGMAKAYGGEQSKAYQALFAVSKAFAVAKATLNLTEAISTASTLPWPTNIPAMIQAASAGASLVATLQGTNYAGAYDNGGDIPAGKIGMVGENGLELIQGPAHVTSRKDTEQLLKGIGGNSGNGGSGQIAVTITLYDNRTQAETKDTGVDKTIAPKLAELVKGVVIKTLLDAKRPGGLLA